VTLLSFKFRSQPQEHYSVRAVCFAIEDPVESRPITFDECQSQSLDPQFEAVKFEGLGLSQP